ncbi:MAG: hypothetical protein CL728_04985 [Chloroflexi bacterium]|nr:hypothetical protein [Chloroflexota bacterium]
MREGDGFTTHHRGHGIFLARGADPKRMMAEIAGKSSGYCRGKGGSMHIADMGLGHLGANAIVGGGISHVVGAGLTYQMKHNGNAAVAFFGDGASSQGVLHESMNLASIWKLPVIFACENNQYAEATPSWYAVSVEDIADRAASYNIPGVIVDGMDVFQVYEAAEEAVLRARKGLGPTLLELKTYRYHGHFHADQPEKYRTSEEEKIWKNRDCIKTFEKKVLDQKLMTKKKLDSIKKNIEKEIEAAVEFGLSSPLPPTETLYEDVYVNYSNDLKGLR